MKKETQTTAFRNRRRNALNSQNRNYAAEPPGSLTLPFKPHNTQILYLSLLWAQ